MQLSGRKYEYASKIHVLSFLQYHWDVLECKGMSTYLYRVATERVISAFNCCSYSMETFFFLSHHLPISLLEMENHIFPSRALTNILWFWAQTATVPGRNKNCTVFFTQAFLNLSVTYIARSQWSRLVQIVGGIAVMCRYVLVWFMYLLKCRNIDIYSIGYQSVNMNILNRAVCGKWISSEAKSKRGVLRNCQ